MQRALHRRFSVGESAAVFGPFLSFLKTLSVYAYALLFLGSFCEVFAPIAILAPGEFFFMRAAY